MSHILTNLEKAKAIRPPDWLSTNTHYLTIMGSQAYGVTYESSDLDIYGFAIPRKDMVFPHLKGEIPGFGRQVNRFEQWQEHHIPDPDGKDRIYDLQVFSIVKYFHLLMDCNPNIIDSLFTPYDCVLHCTQIGNLVRENRRLFLHKGAFHRYKGYAYSQMHKMKNKEPEGKRKETVEKYGFDTKFAYHLVRLLSECEQILISCDLDLRQNNEQLKAIRRGEMGEEDIIAWATEKERHLESLYESSKLPYSPDEDRIKKLLLECLETHYGSIDNAIVMPDRFEIACREMKEILEKLKL